MNSYGDKTIRTYVPAGAPGAGSVASVTDAKGTNTYGYGTDANGKTERRGMPTRLNVSGLGEFTAAYDEYGQLEYEELPGGVRKMTEYDGAGEPTGLTYAGRVTTVDDTGTASVGTVTGCPGVKTTT